MAIDARRHGQGGGTCSFPWKFSVKCFCALVVTAKRSVDELFMHYFYNLSSASGGFDPDRGSISAGPRCGTFVARSLISPSLEKNPACAHGCDVQEDKTHIKHNIMACNV